MRWQAMPNIYDPVSKNIFTHIISRTRKPSQRLHILKLLKRRGLSLEMLHNVFYAIIVSKLAYGISYWYSFLVKAQIAQINSVFKRAFKYGYVKSTITVEELYSGQL